MKVNGNPYRTIWLAEDGWTVEIIDQRRLPHVFEIIQLTTLADAADAIADMAVRGAPLIGVTAAYGMSLALRADGSDTALREAAETLRQTRPTAVNLAWAIEQITQTVAPLKATERAAAAYARATEMADEDVETCRLIGENGLDLIRERADANPGRPVNILTHCNAGWLATVDWGTALSPIYHAHEAGIPVHVWVDETRPRNQGAALTAWELGAHGIDHTIIADNTGGHLMQNSQVDMCIVGTDRTAANGDVANKIGTYLKALAADDNNVPFYVALPHSTIDWQTMDGLRDIPIEQRDGTELTRIAGRQPDGKVVEIDIAAPGSAAANYAFDVTPARLVTGLVTERGICPASHEGLLGLYPEKSNG